MAYNPVNPNGQTTKANSAPVTIASDQNIALETGGNLASIVTNTNSLNNTVGTLSAGNAATKSLAVGGVYNSSAPTPTTGQQLSLQLDGSGNLKISGTVTANLGTIDGAATATGQTDGSQKTKIVDGSGNVIGATSNALDVNIKSGGSSGTQYTNNAVQATPTGTVALGYDGTNVRGLLTDGTGKLQTNITGQVSATTTPVTVRNTGNITTSSSFILSTSSTGFSWALVTIHGAYSGIKFGITASDDSGTTYYNVPIWDVQNNKYIAPGSTISPADNSSASFIVPQSSNTSIVKVLATAYTSGTGYVAITGQSNSPAILSTEVNNSAVAGVGMQTASNSILNTLTAIKASGTNTPSTLYGWYFFNNNSTVAYCQIFDVSSTGSATLGTTAPTMSFGIPAFGGANAFPTQGIKFSNGIVIAMTTTRAGSTAPTTSVDYNIFYQ